MVNLLTNAAQAIPPGDPGHHVVSIVTRAAGGQVLIEVKDTGIGIPAAVQNRIFDPFFTTKPHGEGTGLGLSISLGIVQELGGTIEVTSEPGRGSTFRVLLPASALPVVEEAPADVLPEGPRRRVLIVDDDPAVAHALAGALERVHDVACAFEGREALARLGSGEPFDAVVCDLEMPGVSGMDVFEKVMAQDPSLGARFIFMTGGTFTDRARAFRERVSNTVLNKPLDSASVRRHIEAVPRA
jgi:CheY-like chemotaxis protein